MTSCGSDDGAELSAKTNKRPGNHRAIPGRVIAGAFPASLDDQLTDRTLTMLLELGITTFVCLQSEFNLHVSEPEWRSSGKLRPYIKDAQRILSRAREAGDPKIQQQKIDFLLLSIVDGSVTSDEAMNNLAEDCIQRVLRGEKLYIHCWGGHGRTGTLVATMLGRLYNLQYKDAIKYCQAFHDSRVYPQNVQSPHTSPQRAQVQRLLLMKPSASDRGYSGISASAPPMAALPQPRPPAQAVRVQASDRPGPVEPKAWLNPSKMMPRGLTGYAGIADAPHRYQAEAFRPGVGQGVSSKNARVAHGVYIPETRSSSPALPGIIKPPRALRGAQPWSSAPPAHPSSQAQVWPSDSRPPRNLRHAISMAEVAPARNIASASSADNAPHSAGPLGMSPWNLKHGAADPYAAHASKESGMVAPKLNHVAAPSGFGDPLAGPPGALNAAWLPDRRYGALPPLWNDQSGGAAQPSRQALNPPHLRQAPLNLVGARLSHIPSLNYGERGIQPQAPPWRDAAVHRMAMGNGSHVGIKAQ